MFQVDEELAKLNDKQRRFVYEYIAIMKPGKAAIAAGYSKKTANVQGSKLLAHGKIRRIVDHLLQERAKVCEVDASIIFQAAWDIAKAAPSLFVKNSDRLRAMELCAKYTGGFSDRVEHDVKGELHIRRTDYALPLPPVLELPKRHGKVVSATYKEGKLVC